MAEDRSTIELLTAPDVAQILGVGLPAVYKLVESRDESLRLPVIRIGKRRFRVRREDLDAWIERRSR